ncbi:alanine dehydrogenase [Nonomuraea fuscirosea]|uniref:alanine dehydrogenase n=1 Tax=Nonomuraea fuscirosea TaxID=1291556 RepID=UPI0033F2AEF2
MKIGVPRELKNHEYRVAVTPAGVYTLTGHGHDVLIEHDAGTGSSISDEEYVAAGAKILTDADDVWAESDLILKVKEPIPAEYHRMRPGQVLFTYLHLAASRQCTEALLERQVTAIAYETVETDTGALPLLAPMSEVAGRLAPQVGAYHLMASAGGRGLLPGGVPGTPPARVVVIGAGVSGMNATGIAVGMGAEVTLLDVNLDRLPAADALHRGRVRTVASTAYQIEEAVEDADLVIGAVLIPGAQAPTLVPTELVARMRSGAVLVDIAIDQGGCFADSQPTTHAEPTYRVHDTIFYCVANMPGAVPNTSTHALTSATLPYVTRIADRGWHDALRTDRALARGLSTHNGRLTSPSVAAAHGLDHVPFPGTVATAS